MSEMTTKRLMRFGAGAAAVLALAAFAACGPTKTNSTNTTTNTVTVTTPAGGLGLGMSNATGGTGGMTGGMNGGNAMANNGGTTGGMGGDTGGMTGGNNGGMTGGNNGGMGGDTGNGGNMQAASSQWDASTYNSCVPSAMQNGASAPVAQQYCQCVVNALDQLPVQQKLALTPQSPELGQAVSMCRPRYLQ
jgi:hypothetical protein